MGSFLGFGHLVEDKGSILRLTNRFHKALGPNAAFCLGPFLERLALGYGAVGLGALLGVVVDQEPVRLALLAAAALLLRLAYFGVLDEELEWGTRSRSATA
jgi:hypothetical protein